VAQELSAQAGAEMRAFNEAGMSATTKDSRSGSSPTVTTPRLGSRVVKG